MDNYSGTSYIGDVRVEFSGVFYPSEEIRTWDGPKFESGYFELNKVWLTNDKSETDIYSMLSPEQRDRLEHEGYVEACKSI